MSKPDRRLWRVMDANSNRACEGLRVAEDVLRFCLNDSSLSASARSLRHALGRAVESMVPRRRLIEGRDARGDVGASRWKGGQTRARLGDLLAANLRRAQESARVLEEFSRLHEKPSATRRLQSIRYSLYTLEAAALGITGRGRSRR